MRAIVTGGVAGVLGVGLGWFGRGEPPRRPVAAPAAPAAVAATECPPCPACPASAGESLPDAACERAVSQVEGLSEAAFGTPLQWGEPGGAAAAEATVDEVLGRCPLVRRLAVDCSEPPCLLSVSLGENTFDDVRTACPGWGRLKISAYESRARACPDGHSELFAVVQANTREPFDRDVGADPSSNQRTRFHTRGEGLKDLWTCP